MKIYDELSYKMIVRASKLCSIPLRHSCSIPERLHVFSAEGLEQSRARMERKLHMPTRAWALDWSTRCVWWPLRPRRCIRRLRALPARGSASISRRTDYSVHCCLSATTGQLSFSSDKTAVDLSILWKAMRGSDRKLRLAAAVREYYGVTGRRCSSTAGSIARPGRLKRSKQTNLLTDYKGIFSALLVG